MGICADKEAVDRTPRMSASGTKQTWYEVETFDRHSGTREVRQVLQLRRSRIRSVRAARLGIADAARSTGNLQRARDI